jgi:4-hydroxy-tetrahydrodipicolinate synthase
MGPNLRGIIPPVITPFDENEMYSPGAMKDILDYLIDKGVHAVFVAGSVSEFFCLRLEEIKEVIRTSVKAVDGRVPVLAGTGAISTRDTIELSQYAESVGADALSVITPYYIKPTEQELYHHYATVAGSVKIPVLGYTNPGRAGGMTLSAGLMKRLAEEFENVVGIKDSSGDMDAFIQYRTVCPPDFLVFTGRDTLILDAVVQGGAGSVAGIANFAPELLVSVYELAVAGDLDAARKAQQRVVLLRQSGALGSFPSAIKEAAAMIGLPAGPTRRPTLPLTSQARAELRRVLAETLGEDALVA